MRAWVSLGVGLLALSVASLPVRRMVVAFALLWSGLALIIAGAAFAQVDAVDEARCVAEAEERSPLPAARAIVCNANHISVGSIVWTGIGVSVTTAGILEVLSVGRQRRAAAWKWRNESGG